MVEITVHQQFFVSVSVRAAVALNTEIIKIIIFITIMFIRIAYVSNLASNGAVRLK